jgi:hypothetical protein
MLLHLLLYIFVSTNILFLFITILNNCFYNILDDYDFGRHPNFRKKLDVEQLANSVRSWPGIQYSVSSCKSVRPLPIRVIIIIIFDTSNIKPISDSYSNKIRKWIYSIHTGKRYQNCLHFGPYSYWSYLPTQPTRKICSPASMDCWILT